MSPRAWGCTGVHKNPQSPYPNVPTCVGVYRHGEQARIHRQECPHVRGGVPLLSQSSLVPKEMSPRAWGCTEIRQALECLVINVPTCVGVYRDKIAAAIAKEECPHVRGGVPTSRGRLTQHQKMSPRAWGCTDYRIDGA